MNYEVSLHVKRPTLRLVSLNTSPIYVSRVIVHLISFLLPFLDARIDFNFPMCRVSIDQRSRADSQVYSFSFVWFFHPTMHIFNGIWLDFLSHTHTTDSRHIEIVRFPNGMHTFFSLALKLICNLTLVTHSFGIWLLCKPITNMRSDTSS